MELKRLATTEGEDMFNDDLLFYFGTEKTVSSIVSISTSGVFNAGIDGIRPGFVVSSNDHPYAQVFATEAEAWALVEEIFFEQVQKGFMLWNKDRYEANNNKHYYDMW